MTGTLVAGDVREGDELLAVPRGLAVKVRGLQVHGSAASSAAAGRRRRSTSAASTSETWRAATRWWRPARSRRRGCWTRGCRWCRASARFDTARACGFTRALARRLAASPWRSCSPTAPEEIGRRGGARRRRGAGRGRRIRSDPPRGGSRPVARRPVHSPGVFAADYDCRRRGAGSASGPRRDRPRRPAPASSGSTRAAPGAGREDWAVSALVAEAAPPGSAPRRSSAAPGSTPVGRRGRRSARARRFGRQGGAVLLTPGARRAGGRRAETPDRSPSRRTALGGDAAGGSARTSLRPRRRRGVRRGDRRVCSRPGPWSARDRLALASHRVSLTPEEERARQAIDLAFRAAGLTPPDLREVAQSHAIRDAVLDRVIKLLVRQRALARLDTMLFHQEALDALKRDLVALKAAAPDGRATIDVGIFKQRYGLSRIRDPAARVPRPRAPHPARGRCPPLV